MLEIPCTQKNEGCIKIYTVLDDNLIALWQELWDTSTMAHNCNRSDWLLAYQDAFGSQPFQIITYFKGNKLEGILPLIQSRLYGIYVLTMPGGSFLNKAMILTRTDDTAVINALCAATAKLGTILLKEISESHYSLLKSDRSWYLWPASISLIETLLTEETGKLKEEHPKRIRNIIKHKGSELRYEVYSGDDLDKLDVMVAIEQASFKQSDGRTIFHDRRVQSLYRSLMQRMPRSCILVIVFDHDVPISHSFGMLYKDTFLGMHTAYRKESRKMMPGKIAMLFLLQELVKLGIKKIDLGRGDQPTKRQFANEVIIQYNALYCANPFIRIYLQTLISLRTDVWDKLPENFKKIPRRLIRYFLKTQSS